MRDAKTFFRIVGALWLAAIGFIVYRERHQWPGLPSGALTERVWREIGDFTFVVLVDFGTVAMAITIVAMLLARALNSRSLQPGELPRSLTRKEVVGRSPSLAAYFT